MVYISSLSRATVVIDTGFDAPRFHVHAHTFCWLSSGLYISDRVFVIH